MVRSAAKPLEVDHIPTFEEYPAKKAFEGTPAPVNLFSHHNARRLRDRLVEPAKAGPNFAGSLTVIAWRSASGTQQIAVVDAQTGLIHLPSLLASHLESEFRLDSRLFIANPPGRVAIHSRQTTRPRATRPFTTCGPTTRWCPSIRYRISCRSLARSPARQPPSYRPPAARSPQTGSRPPRYHPEWPRPVSGCGRAQRSPRQTAPVRRNPLRRSAPLRSHLMRIPPHPRRSAQSPRCGTVSCRQASVAAPAETP